LSNNHTCINPRTGQPEPFYDICDELEGDYPKTFEWSGWHPQCRCVMTPILVDTADFRKMLDAEVAGKAYAPQQITKMPDKFTKWIETNRNRLERAQRLPYWIKNDEIKITNKTGLNEFNGSLQSFANKVLTSKRANNEIKRLGTIDDYIIADMKNKGINIASKDIFITDKVILKYINHPKAAKGAVINFQRFSEVEKTINNSQNIYEQINSKSLVYAYTFPYDNKVLKVIIQPNYKLKDNFIHLLKSIGIIESRDMNSPYYRKIQIKG
jgi:hypothetical protein